MAFHFRYIRSALISFSFFLLLVHTVSFKHVKCMFDLNIWYILIIYIRNITYSFQIIYVLWDISDNSGICCFFHLIMQNILIILFKFIYLFSESTCTHRQAGKGQRETERESQAGSCCQSAARPRALCHEPWDHDLS